VKGQPARVEQRAVDAIIGLRHHLSIRPTLIGRRVRARGGRFHVVPLAPIRALGGVCARNYFTEEVIE
jgi:hypothetical protein